MEQLGAIRQQLTDRLQRIQSPEGSLGGALRQTGENQVSLIDPATKYRGDTEMAGIEDQISAYDLLTKAQQMGVPEAKEIGNAIETFLGKDADAQQKAALAQYLHDNDDGLTPNNILTMTARGVRELGLSGASGKAQSSIGKMYDDEKRGLIPPGTTQGYISKQSYNPNAPRKLSSIEQKELFEQEDVVSGGASAIDAISEARGLIPKAYTGFAAETLADLARTPLIGDIIADKDRGAATTMLKNLASEQTISQLKAVFGGMPTEGERKVLLDMQALPSYTTQEQEAILKRAEQAIQRRMANAEQRVSGIQTGDYARPGMTRREQQGPVQIMDDMEYDALPSGTQFIDPDGEMRVKP